MNKTSFFLSFFWAMVNFGQIIPFNSRLKCLLGQSGQHLDLTEWLGLGVIIWGVA